MQLQDHGGLVEREGRAGLELGPVTGESRVFTHVQAHQSFVNSWITSELLKFLTVFRLVLGMSCLTINEYLRRSKVDSASVADDRCEFHRCDY